MRSSRAASSYAAVAVLCGCVGALALDSGGYFPHAWVWSSVLLLWLAALALGIRSTLVLGRWALAFVAAAAALSLWTLLSSIWSIVPSQSVLEARRDIVYFAGAVAVVAAVDRHGASLIPAGTLAAVSVASVAGIGRYLISGPVDPAEGVLLSWPVGYANAFAALAAAALPVALALAAHGRRDAARAAAAAAVPVLVLVLQLTSSRGGAIAAAAGLVSLFMLDRRRRTVVRTTLRLLPGVLIVVIVSAWADPGAATTDISLRRVGVAAALALATAGGALVVARRRGVAVTGPEVTRRTATVVAAVVVAAGAVVAALPGLGAVGAARRVVAVERAEYWRVAWHDVARHLPLGSGAGTFGRVWFEHGPVALYAGALDAHNLYLETLAELGGIGLVLLLAFLALPLMRARAAALLSRMGAAGAAAYIAFLVHAGVDWDWEMPAVTLFAIAIGGSMVVVADRRPSAPPLHRQLRLGLAVAAVVLALAALLGLRSGVSPSAAEDAPVRASSNPRVDATRRGPEPRRHRQPRRPLRG